MCLGKDREAPISTGNAPFLKKTHLPPSAGDLEQIVILGEGGKEAQSSAVLLCAQTGLAGPFPMGILGLSSHSRRAFHPQTTSIYRTFETRNIPVDQTALGYSI